MREGDFTFLILEDEEGQRLDKFLADQPLELSRSHIKRLITEGKVLVNKEVCKPSHKVAAGDLVSITIPKVVPPSVLPESIPLDIIFEDDDLLVVNKPPGMVTHPAPGHYSGTLVNGLLAHTSQLSSINGIMRPGILHRLDKDTSGLLVVAKRDGAHLRLAKQVQSRTMKRKYLVVVHGIPRDDEGRIEAPIGRHPIERKRMAVTLKPGRGREAITNFKVVERFKDSSLLEVSLETGRTHQIRVHLAHIGHPVVGDSTYGRRKGIPFSRQALHAQRLGIIHPRTGEYKEFASSLPDDLRELLESLRKNL